MATDAPHFPREIDETLAMRRRTLTLTLLTVTYFFSYMDRQILAIMASTTSRADEGEAISMADFGRDLVQRRAQYEAEYGPVPIPRNDGTRRTASKRALLDAVDAAAAKKGFHW